MSVQLLIILIYFALTILIGFLSSRRSHSSAGFNGAQLGLASIVCASTGEWLGGTATTGVSEYGFIYGLSGAWYTIANGIGVMFLALCFAKLYRSLGSVTVPGLVEHWFGRRARTVSAVLLVIVMLAVGLSQMIAAGKLGESLLGLDFNLTVVIFALIFIVYTLAGGMNAVASTNKMHLFVMYGGVIAALLLSVSGLGGWSSFTSGVAQLETEGGSFFNMFAIGPSKVSSWIIASLLGACTAQAGIQPVLAAKDVPTAKRACIITAFVAAPFGLLTALLGMAARVMSENGTLVSAGVAVTDAKLALPALMMSLPPLAGGIVLSSILAAILSTVSPIILSCGTMLTNDLYRLIEPEADDKKLLRVSRVTTAAAGVICCIASMLLVGSARVLDLVYAAYSLRGALFVVILLGIYWRGASETGACLSMVTTGVAAVVWQGCKLATGEYPLAPWFTETYAAIIFALAATVVFSLIFPRRELREHSS